MAYEEHNSSYFILTLACLPSMTATQEFVVPRSMPMTAPFTASDLKHRLLLSNSFIQIYVDTHTHTDKLLTHSPFWTEL